MKVSIVGSLRDREVACSASDRQGSNFESCVWRTVSSQSSHHPQEVLLAQFSLYVHKGGLEPDSFHFFSGIQVSKKQSASSSLTCKYLILCGTSVTEDRARPQTNGAQISNPVSGGQCHLIHLTIRMRFSWPSLAYKLCAQRWPTTPFIHAFWVICKHYKENVHGS